jgi:hypothetical protein
MMCQSLILMNTDTSGGLLDNGTWTDTLSELQSNAVDEWATTAFMSAERNKHFKCTTPFDRKFDAEHFCIFILLI